MANDLDAEIIIDGVHYESYLTRLERTSSLSHPGDSIILYFDSSFPHDDILPWNSLVVHEQGVKTMTGYVTEIIPKRAPAFIEVHGQDTFKRALEWFLPENLFTSGSQNIGYWVNYLCNECGISYSIDETSGSEIVLNPDIQIGMRMVGDSLTTLCAVAQWQMQVDANGTLHFDHIEAPSRPDFYVTEIEGFEDERNDYDTRNAVKIWGFESTGSGGGVLYSDSRDVQGVSGTRYMVFAEPNITNYSQATSLANAALDQWARLEHTVSADVVGNPSIRPGHGVSLGLTTGSYLDTITDMKSILSEQGYVQSLTAGRRAYRYPYWPVINIPETKIVILLDSTCKVIYTLDITATSPTWVDHSNGLSGTPICVYFDRADGYQCYCLTSTGLFRTDNLWDTDPWVNLFSMADVQSRMGTSDPCYLSHMACDPRLPGRIVMLGGIVGGNARVFWSVDGGDTITSGSIISNYPIVGGISFGPTSGLGFITYYSVGEGNNYGLKFTNNGATLLTPPQPYGHPEVFTPAPFIFHQRSAYSNKILIWPTVLPQTVSTSTNGGTGLATFTLLASGKTPLYTGQAGATHRSQLPILMMSDDNLVYRSFNFGVSWALATGAGITVNALLNLIDSGNNWIAAGSGVRRTKDFATTWVDKNGNLTSIVASPDIIWTDIYNTEVAI